MKEANSPIECNKYKVVESHGDLFKGGQFSGFPYIWHPSRDECVYTYDEHSNMVGSSREKIPRECVEIINSREYFNNSNPSGFCEMERDEKYKNSSNKLGRQYDNLKIEPIEYIQQNNLGFCEGSIIKYVSMWKNSKTPLKDLEKAKDYIERLIKRESSS